MRLLWLFIIIKIKARCWGHLRCHYLFFKLWQMAGRGVGTGSGGQVPVSTLAPPRSHITTSANKHTHLQVTMRSRYGDKGKATTRGKLQSTTRETSFAERERESLSIKELLLWPGMPGWPAWVTKHFLWEPSFGLNFGILTWIPEKR